MIQVCNARQLNSPLVPSQMDIDQAIKGLNQKDLRILLRNRGLQPAGGNEELKQRLKEDMQATGNYSLDLGGGGPAPPAFAGE